MIKLLKSPAILASFDSSSHRKKSFSKTTFLSSDPSELCGRLKLLLQEKRAGNNSDISFQEMVAIADKLLEYKCISKKQHKQLLIEFNL